MESITAIRAQLAQDGDLNTIRCAISDLIIHHLQRSKASHNVGALDHLTNAVGTLSLNVTTTRQPTTAGLVLCLRDIEKAMEELDNPENDTYQLNRKRAEAVTYDMLTEAVQRIRNQAACDTPNDDQAA